MSFMKYKETKEQQLERQIREALSAYAEYADGGENLNEIENASDNFVKRLAKDAARAKEPLRAMMRKSPAWDEALDALIINGNRTHEPDYEKIETWLGKLFCPIMHEKLGNAFDFAFSHNWWAISNFFWP